MIRILPLFCCLAACSGAGAGGAGNPAPGDAFAALQDRVTVQGITPFATLPETGDVAYDGRVRLTLPLGGAAPSLYDGDLDLRVSFGTNPDPVTGSIGNLQGAGGAVTGSLQIGDGVFYPIAPERDYQFTAGLSGSLTQNAISHVITAEMSGDFYGLQGAGVAGVIARGAVRQGDEIDVFDGSFGAERTASGR
ncbi:hypothetical protein [Yoonia vestfoldensis]|uniref:hypothetical protein n=1 Tax=Yoonia vestfoldensis TaxID=245188 RepID=UPI0003720D68|nr:hypothetical protein [Yoonia vestfoldensis]